MSIRKASIVALGIFGSLTGVESQTHAGLLIIVAFLVIHLAVSPYDKHMDPKGILHALDTSSLVIIWGTLWSGLLFYRGDMDLVGKEILSVTIVLVNLLFTVTGIYLLARELVALGAARGVGERDDRPVEHDGTQQLDAHAQTRSELAAKAKELAEATGPAQAPQLTPF